MSAREVGAEEEQERDDAEETEKEAAAAAAADEEVDGLGITHKDGAVPSVTGKGLGARLCPPFTRVCVCVCGSASSDEATRI